MERVATHLADLWGDGASWKRDADPGAHEAHYLRLDSSKACAQLGWRPRLKIELALEWTVHSIAPGTMVETCRWRPGTKSLNMNDSPDKSLVRQENKKIANQNRGF